jgi:hypothetical protein
MIHPIVQKYLTKLLFGFWMIAIAPPFLFLCWLVHSQRDLLFGIPLALGWILGSWWLSLKTVHHMVDENCLFLTAVKHTLYDLRLMIIFMPFIGCWFKPDEDKTQNDDDAA